MRSSHGIDGPTVPTDDRMRAADGLWAVGDVTGVSAFTHLAVHQAWIAVADIPGRDGPARRLRRAPEGDFHRP